MVLMSTRAFPDDDRVGCMVSTVSTVKSSSSSTMTTAIKVAIKAPPNINLRFFSAGSMLVIHPDKD